MNFNRPEVKYQGPFFVKKSLQKLTVQKPFSFDTSKSSVPHMRVHKPQKVLSEADRLYAMLEQKGILNIDEEEP